MQAYYNILTTLKTQLESDRFCNTVTEGDLFEVDLSKQTIFPLSHIIVNEMTKESNVLIFNVSILCMDVVDKSKDEATDKFRGNDNEQDVINAQMAVALRLVEVLERGGDNKTFMMRGNPTFEPFTERFENYLAGVTVTFDIYVPNTMSACDSVNTPEVCKPATYLVEYADGTDIQSGSIQSGGSVTVTVPNSTEINTLPYKTGANVSYITGDDGDNQFGSGDNFFTLSENNIFGNNYRFTDELGTQVYANDIIIDHAHRTPTHIHGWYRNPTANRNLSLATLNEVAALNISGFTGWFLPNRTQIQTLVNSQESNCTNWPPLNISTTYYLRTSNTRVSNTNNCYVLLNINHALEQESKSLTGSRAYIPMRYFTITGNTLT